MVLDDPVPPGSELVRFPHVRKEFTSQGCQDAAHSGSTVDWHVAAANNRYERAHGFPFRMEKDMNTQSQHKEAHATRYSATPTKIIHFLVFTNYSGPSNGLTTKTIQIRNWAA